MPERYDPFKDEDIAARPFAPPYVSAAVLRAEKAARPSDPCPSDPCPPGPPVPGLPARRRPQLIDWRRVARLLAEGLDAGAVAAQAGLPDEERIWKHLHKSLRFRFYLRQACLRRAAMAELQIGPALRHALVERLRDSGSLSAEMLAAIAAEARHWQVPEDEGGIRKAVDRLAETGSRDAVQAASQPAGAETAAAISPQHETKRNEAPRMRTEAMPQAGPQTGPDALQVQRARLVGLLRQRAAGAGDTAGMGDAAAIDPRVRPEESGGRGGHLHDVMAGLVPAIHVAGSPTLSPDSLLPRDVDGRDKPGHDGISQPSASDLPMPPPAPVPAGAGLTA